MRAFVKKFAVYFAFACLFSFIINMLMLTPAFYMLQVYDRVLASRSLETLLMLTLLLALFLLAMSALEMVRSRLLVKANIALDDKLAPYLLHKMLAGATSPEGNPYATGLKDLNSIKSFLGGVGILALFDAPWLPFYLTILYLMDPLLFIVAFIGSILMLVLSVINNALTRAPLDQAGQEGRQAANYVTSALRNAEVVNAMGMLGGLTRRWASLNGKTLAFQNTASNRAGAVSGVTKFLRQFLQSFILGVGAYLVLQNTGFTAGLMIMGSIIMGRALSPIEFGINAWKGMIEAWGAYLRLDAFIKEQTQELPRMSLPAPTGQISFERVSFGIRATNKVILRDMSFALEAGELMGIIGPSAAGKSTIARLMTGVWKPISGKIRLDGVDLSTWNPEDLGPYIGYIPQDMGLFTGSIAENIARLGEVDTDKVIDAAKAAGIHQMILRLPGGYDTQVGEGGAALSGGQRQRIVLARALFGAPRIVILDEPNASLDNEGEQALLMSLMHLKKMKTTTVLITHKISLVSAVDKLLVVQDGVLTDFGPREAVLIRLAQKQKQAQQQPASPPLTQSRAVVETGKAGHV